jgi:hypothetical protein
MDPEAARQIVSAVEDSFIHALATAMWLSFGVTVLGAIAAAVLIERRPVQTSDQPTGLAEAAA